MEITILEFVILTVLLSLLAFLWVADAFFTIKLTKFYELGEKNQIIRKLLKKKKIYFWIFKVTDFIFLVILNFLLALESISSACYLLAIFVFTYSVITYSNWRIIKKIEKERGIKIPLFVTD